MLVPRLRALSANTPRTRASVHRTRGHHHPHPRPRHVHRSPRSAEAISAIRVASISPSRRTVIPRASITTDPIGPGPVAPSTSSGPKPAAAPARHPPVAPMTPPRACPRRRGCATSTTASARSRSGGRLRRRASQAADSRAPPAPCPPRSSAGASDASPRHPSRRRSPEPDPRRNLVHNPASADPHRKKRSSNAIT